MSDASLGSLRDFAERTAREAGSLLTSRLAGGIGANDVISAHERDIKLKSDQAAEKLIITKIKAFDDAPILTEESGAHGAADEAGDLWIVDPLDGSLNFYRGMPFACVSIARWQRGRPCVGVVFDFLRNELFSSEVGQGAWLNGSPIHVSTIREAKDAVLMTGFPSKAAINQETLQRFAGYADTFKKIRMMGAAALMLAWVACGRCDAYAEDGIMLWDVAARLALVEAAGGWVAWRPGVGKWQYSVRAAAGTAFFNK